MKFSVLLCASSALFFPIGSAIAQSSQPEKVANEEAATTDIVVTGSRVVQNGDEQPTPVTVISTADLQLTQPGNLTESLNILPVFAGSRTQASNTGTSGAAGAPATSTNAVNVLNLRNMGLARTLILYDGHRAPPSTPDGFVDVDTIPQFLLKRVDVVTGGVSAVYGSDAISGVVNFITDTKFTGIKAEAQFGISHYGDDPTFEGGIGIGKNLLDDRLHIMASYNYRRDDGVLNKTDRPWGADVRTLQGEGTAAFPYFQVIGARQSNVTFAGRINAINNTTPGPLFDLQFNNSGTALIPFVHGVKTGQGGTISNAAFEIGGDGGFYTGNIRSQLQMHQAFGRIDYEASDALKFFASVAYTKNHSVGFANYFNSTNLQIQKTNAFLPASVVAGMGTTSTFTLGKIFREIPRSELEANVATWLTTVGFEGDLGNSWKYELAYVRGSTNFNVTQNAAINQGRFFAAIDSVDVGQVTTGTANGQIACRAAVAYTGHAANSAYSGCVPFNPFGANALQTASLAYFVQQVGWQTKLDSHDISGHVVGSPFSTWAGPVTVALSGEWRQNSESVASNALPSGRADCVGILGNCGGNTQIHNVTTAAFPKATVNVTEFAGEVQIPLARDTAGFQSLDINLAARHAHYSTAGNAVTWKAGLVWKPIESLTLRATRSRDFRAPTLDELYRPQALSLTNFTDTISGVGVNVTQIPTYNGGNPNLKPEIANTITFGAVFQPISSLSFAVDYYKIKVKNLIFLVQGNSPPEQNICYASKGTSPYCSLITRGLGLYDKDAAGALTAANAVTAWYQLPINIALQTTEGVDFEANLRTEIASRPFSLRLLATYQPHIVFQRDGFNTNDYAGVAFGTNGTQASPKWRFTAFLNFKPTDSLSIGIQQRWRSSLKFHSDPTIVTANQRVKSVGFTNVNLAYDIKAGNADMQFFGNVSNLFNTNPPQAGFWGNPNPGQFGEFALGDDVIGRYFTFGVRTKF